MPKENVSSSQAIEKKVPFLVYQPGWGDSVIEINSVERKKSNLRVTEPVYERPEETLGRTLKFSHSVETNEASGSACACNGFLELTSRLDT